SVSDSSPARDRSGLDQSNRPLLRGLDFGLGGGGQLQHFRALAFAQTREQHDLTAREFERVMMHMRLIVIDLAEPRQFFPDLSVPPGLESSLTAPPGDARATEVGTVTASRTCPVRSRPRIERTGGERRFALAVRIAKADEFRPRRRGLPRGPAPPPFWRRRAE